MSGHADRGRYGNNDNQGGDRGGSRYGERGQDRRRSRSPVRDSQRSSRGGRGRDRQDDGQYGGPQGGARVPDRNSLSNISPMPTSAPFPEGTGGKVPYTDLAPRGTIGTRALFFANHYSIETLPTIKIYQYDLRFKVPVTSQARGSDKVTANQMARVLVNATVVGFLGPNFVFDGVSMGWSPNELIAEGASLTSIISLGDRPNGRPNEVEIEVRNVGLLNIAQFVAYLRAAKIDINPMGTRSLELLLKWLNAVFRAEPARKMITRPNTNAYFSQDGGNSMALRSTGGVLQALRGLFQTVQIRFNRLTLNVDTATTPFWVGNKPMIECVCAMAGIQSTQGLSQYFLENPGRFFQACGKLLGIFFSVKHLQPHQNAKKIKFNDWTAKDAIGTIFEEQERENAPNPTSVVDYYLRKYGIRIQFPQLPLAHTRHGDFPLELCFSAAGERYKGVLQGTETTDFIKFATAPAYVRRQQILSILHTLGWHSQPTIKAHGLSVNPNMMQVKALVLPPPRIIYGSNGTAQPREGQWNLRGLRLLRPSTIKSWVLLSFTRRTDVLEALGFELMKGFKQVGISIPNKPPATLRGNPQGDMEIVVQESIQKARVVFGMRPDIIFVLFESPSVPIYKAVKHALDVKEGIASQVMSGEKAIMCQAQYIANIALKVNAKLGGTNSTINESLFKQARYMLIGGDTSISRAGDVTTTTALTGTFDRECSAFTCVAAMQPSTNVNIIDNAPLMFKELLSRYKEKNDGKMPEKIIYFRDGASESEFELIRNKEGLPLRELCKESGTKITIVLAIKRHHTRFFAEGQLATKLGNVPTGTAIENSTARNDSFIITHGDLQGTKRGTRYISLVDENHLSTDDFHRLINNLCSTYARATRSVAVVPPIYYAHQACERANIHLQDKPDGTKFLPQVHQNLKWNMYWQ